MGKQKIQSRFVWKGGLFCCELMCDVCVLRVSFILLSFMYLFFVTVFFNDCFVCSVWSGAWLDSLVQSTTYHYRHYSWPISRPPRCIKKQNSLGSCIWYFLVWRDILFTFHRRAWKKTCEIAIQNVFSNANSERLMLHYGICSLLCFFQSLSKFFSLIYSTN